MRWRSMDVASNPGGAKVAPQDFACSRVVSTQSGPDPTTDDPEGLATKDGKLSSRLVWESNPEAGDPVTYTLRPAREANNAAVSPEGPAPAMATS
mmetsp:Transcript_6119/g.12789  ORF Transcript_6119/g.12789 Transcript_6119/m.12789 type:complete len:95 (-) Transcript_6119:251-535(-)